MSREAMQQALEALVQWEDEAPHAWGKSDEDAVAALRAALAEPESDYERGFVDGMQEQMKRSVDKAVNRMAEPEQEPVAWLWPHQLEELQHIHQLSIRAWSGKRYKPDGLVAVYTAPTPRKPLTDEEIERVCAPLGAAMLSFTEVARAIERAHGIGEQT